MTLAERPPLRTPKFCSFIVRLESRWNVRRSLPPSAITQASDDELLAEFEATVMSLRAERRVDGESERLSVPSAPTTF
jgi:hypothetical protein